MQAASTKFVQGQQIRLRLVAKANDSLLSVETFGKNDEGMAIIYFLNARAPINASQQCYNLYKGSECLTYSMLS